MMRLAHLLGPTGVGGMEQVVLDLCRLHGPEFHPLVAVTHEGPILDEIRATGASVYVGHPAQQKALSQADVVCWHTASYDPIWHAAVEASGKPYVVCLQWPSPMPSLPAVVLCSSQFTYELQEHKDHCVIVPNGIDLSRFQPCSRPPSDEVTIVRVCRPPKCALYFWEAMSRVLARYPQARLWIVGDEGGRGISSQQVRFLGVRRDVPEILAQADIFAYAPYPGAGSKDLVIMEACATGLPCVVSQVNAAWESVWEGENGFLTPFGDAEAFADRVGLLVQDPELRRRMGERAAQLAREHFDVRRVVRAYEAVFRSTLAHHRARQRPQAAVESIRRQSDG